jgi:hypothetical protein
MFLYLVCTHLIGDLKMPALIGQNARLKRTFAVDPDLNDLIDIDTTKTGCSRSEIVNRSLALYFGLNDSEEPISAN